MRFSIETMHSALSLSISSIVIDNSFMDSLSDIVRHDSLSILFSIETTRFRSVYDNVSLTGDCRLHFYLAFRKALPVPERATGATVL